MQYFTLATDASIEKFQNSDDDNERKRVFEKEIAPALEKLIQNIIYVYKFYPLGDPETLQRECLSDMYEIIAKGKYNPEKSNNPSKKTSKAFSYFNMVVKNWFIAKSRENNRKNKNESDLYYDLDHEVVRNDPSFVVHPYEELLENKERWFEFYKAMESWRTKLDKKNELHVLEAIIFILKNAELVSVYNKKAVYLYLRDLTGLNTKQIVVNLKKIRTLYAKWHQEFYGNVEISDDDSDGETDTGDSLELS